MNRSGSRPPWNIIWHAPEATHDPTRVCVPLENHLAPPVIFP